MISTENIKSVRLATIENADGTPFELPENLRLSTIPAYDLRPHRAARVREALSSSITAAERSLLPEHLSDVNLVMAASSAAAAASGTLVPVTDNSAFVDAGQVVGGLTPTHQVDVLNSLLFAQLAASAQVKRSDYANWYDSYSSWLKKLGWIFNAGSVTKYDAAGSDFSIDQVALNILAAALTGPEMAVITATIAALKSLANKNDQRITLFERSCHVAQSATFQIGSGNDTGGVVVLKAASFSLTSEADFTNVLFFHFHHQQVTLRYSLDTLTLDSEVYASVRDEVVKDLGKKAQEYIANVPLADRP